MASFAVCSVDSDAVAAAPAAAVTLANKLAGVTATSSKALTGVAIAGNCIASIVLLIPIFTFVVPVVKAHNLQGRNPFAFLSMTFGCIVWIIFVVPSMPKSLPVLTVNGIGVVIQAAYLAFFLWYAGAVLRRRTIKQLLGMLAVAAVLATLMIVLVKVTKVSSPKFLGIIAATFSTASFLVTMVMDILAIKDNRRSLHIVQLGSNLANAIIWTIYGFMNNPVSAIVLVPNITGIATTAVQIIAKVTFCICRLNQNQGRPAAASSA
ncbi:hypothetical protein VPH35_017857 [Triticum aestivum]